MVQHASLMRSGIVWLGVAGLLACSGGNVPTGANAGSEPPAAIVFAANSFTIKEGQTGQLAARVVDAAGHDMPDARVAFSTADAALVGVTDDGTVSGIRPGAAHVTATSGSVHADLTVDVIGHPEGIVVGNIALSARPFGAAVSRAGVVYVTRLDADSLAVTDVTSRTLTGGIAVGSLPTGVAFNQAGTLAYVTNQLGPSVSIVDVATGTEVGVVPISGNPFVVVASPDSSTMYVSTHTNWVFAIDAATHTLIDSIEVGTAPNGFAIHPNDSIMYVSSFLAGTVSEINMKTDAVVRTFKVGGHPQDMIVSRDGTELYVANEAGHLDIWNLGTGTATVSVPLPAGAFGMALSPDDAHLYISLPDTGTVDVVNIASRRIIHSIAVGGRPRRIAFDYHGGTAVVANESGWVDFVR